MEDTEKIYTECITALNRETIIKCAERKVCGYGVAERILKHFNIK